MRPSNDVPGRIGDIVVNLQSLEFALRLFLHNVANRDQACKEPACDFTSANKGDWVPLNALTNYDTLGHLIRKANALLEANGQPERIDESIVQLRDTIAHGRVLAKKPQGPFHIFKFSEPDKSKPQVKVETKVEMTPEWLAAQVTRTHNEALKIKNAARKLGLSCFPE